MTDEPRILYDTNAAPYSQEAEEAVIGAVMINPNAYVALASFITVEDFFLVRHQLIWKVFQRLNERSEAIDYLTVVDDLRGLGELDNIGGAPYLTRLINNTPNSIHAEFYGRIVERTAVRRRLMKVADEIKGLAVDEQLDLDQVVQGAETRLFNVTDRQIKREFVPIADAVTAYFDQMEYLISNPEATHGVPSGFKDLDTLLGGLQRSDLVIFAGRPGMGKTSFLLSTAANAARIGARVAIFTMEMGADQIVQRLISMETGINSQKLRLGQLTPQEYGRFVEAAGRVSRLQVHIDDTPALSPLQMRTKCRRLKHEFGVDMVIVDYLQLMNAGGQYQNNRVQEISYISRSLKELARELNTPIFSAAQLSRAVEQRQDKRPVLSDLRESGSIEQDADVVMFLYRDVVYNEATEFPNQADVIVAKHRNGPTDTISLYFDKTLTKFMDGSVRRIDLGDV
jgi:replicative DNA helicase